MVAVKGDMPSIAADRLNEHFEVVQAMNRLDETALRYKEGLRGLELEREALQKQCPHLIEKYHSGDSSIGEHSYHECEVCGKQT